MNIAHNLERGQRLFPNKTALIFEGKSYTYKELDKLANRIANGLRELGILRGDRVALFLPNIPEFIISYLGILKLGAVAVSLNVMLNRGEVKFILNDCSAKALITVEYESENVPNWGLPELKHILVVGARANNKGISLEQLMASASSNAGAIEMERDEPAAIIYTSGTTEFPKGTILSHGNVISNVYSKNRCCGMRPEDRLLLYLPLFSCFSQNAILNSGINACATIILQRDFEPEQVLKTIATYGITMFFGVPTAFIKLLDMNTSDYDLSSVRYYFTAAPMPVEVVQRWKEKYGRVIYSGYGLTETSHFASYNHDLKYKFGSIGTPIENVEMKIVNFDAKEVKPGELGEIIIRGPNVMLGYWNRPSETAQVLKNGWFHTGDKGWMDDDGYFYIVGRLQNTLNVFGVKVYPAEVENAISQHPVVAARAVHGVADAEK